VTAASISWQIRKIQRGLRVVYHFNKLYAHIEEEEMEGWRCRQIYKIKELKDELEHLTGSRMPEGPMWPL